MLPNERQNDDGIRTANLQMVKFYSTCIDKAYKHGEE